MGMETWSVGQKSHLRTSGSEAFRCFFLHFKMHDVLSRFGRWSKLEAKKGMRYAFQMRPKPLIQHSRMSFLAAFR